MSSYYSNTITKELELLLSRWAIVVRRGAIAVRRGAIVLIVRRVIRTQDGVKKRNIPYAYKPSFVSDYYTPT